MQRALAALLLALCGALLAGCAPKPVNANSPALVVGFSQLGAESGWRIGNTASMEEAAKGAAEYLIPIMKKVYGE